jgi:serine/threonine-protein kinase
MERRLDNRLLIPPQQINRQLSGHINDAIVWGMALEKQNRPQSMSAWLQQLDLSPSPVPHKYQKEFVNLPQPSSKVIAKSSQSSVSKHKKKRPWSLLIGSFASYFIISYFFGLLSVPWWIKTVAWIVVAWMVASFVNWVGNYLFAWLLDWD